MPLTDDHNRQMLQLLYQVTLRTCNPPNAQVVVDGMIKYAELHNHPSVAIFNTAANAADSLADEVRASMQQLAEDSMISLFGNFSAAVLDRGIDVARREPDRPDLREIGGHIAQALYNM